MPNLYEGAPAGDAPNSDQLAMRVAFYSHVQIGELVTVNGPPNIDGYVTGVCWQHSSGATIEVAWIHNGSSQKAWFEAWRVK